MEAWNAISELGRPLWLGILSVVIVAALLRRHKRAASLWAIAMGGAVSIPFAIKALFETARPEGSLVQTVGAGFPSAHAFASATFAALCIVTFSSRIRGRVLRASLVGALCAYAALVGISRIALRAHYLYDVAAGLALGLAWFWISLAIVRRLNRSW